MRWNGWLTGSLALVVVGIVFVSWGSSEADACRSNEILGCMFAGAMQTVLGISCFMGALLAGGYGAWRGWRDDLPRPSYAELEAELTTIERELARLPHR